MTDLDPSDRALRAALRRARPAAAPPPALDAVLAYERPRRKPRAAAVALALALIAAPPALILSDPFAPAEPPSFKIALPNYTGSLADPSQGTRLPSLSTILKRKNS